MKARILTRSLAVTLSVALLLATPVFADDSHHRGGYGGHDYRWHAAPGHSYGGYGGHGYARPPYSYNHGSASGYGHPSGAGGYWGKDARHHYRRSHRHHHGL